MPPADRTSNPILCLDCRNGLARPTGVRTSGPLKIDVTYRCTTCGYEWAVGQQMPGFMATWTGCSQPRSQ
jgi:hypothetical protein